MAKQIPLALVILMALLGGLYGALAWTGRWWWLAAWGFWMVFQLLMVVLYPLVIAPIFNKFKPLDQGPLKDRLSELASRCGFPNRGIFVMDGSRRSRHSNAYFTGLGKFRRIVIFDTLMEALEDDELEAVLAHEIGHWKFGHIRKRLAVSALVTLAGFGLIALLLNWTALYTAFGFSSPSIHAMLFWISFFSSPLTSLVSPISNIWSRKHEYQADKFAAAQTSEPPAMKRALLNLGRDNLSNLTPHPAYSFWHYSHPALGERLKALE
jgi:STE24 endopeptidase